MTGAIDDLGIDIAARRHGRADARPNPCGAVSDSSALTGRASRPDRVFGREVGT